MIRKLELTPEQIELLRRLQQEKELAEASLYYAMDAVLRGFGITSAALVDEDGLTLTVDTPEDEEE